MPVALRFGPRVADEIAPELGASPVVLLVFRDAFRHAEPARLRAALGDRVKAAVEVPDGLSTVALARALSRQLWPALAGAPGSVLLAIGGGSVMDLAKLLRCRPDCGDFDALVPALRGTGAWPALQVARLWLVPTTAGTGSEVTRWATLWDTDDGLRAKRSFDEPFGFAERAYVDPRLSATCPPEVTRDSALDALSHALEALWNRHANPVSSALALTAARRLLATLPALRRDPWSMALRQGLALAALEAGLAFSQTRTALAHALSYELTLESGTPHGLACAVWLPTAWRLAVGHCAEVDALLARVFDTAAADGAAALENWLRAVGVDPRPQAMGIADPDQRVARALRSARGRNFIGSAGGPGVPLAAG